MKLLYIQRKNYPLEGISLLIIMKLLYINWKIIEVFVEVGT